MNNIRGLKKEARESLRGKWVMAALVSVAAAILGASGSDGIKVNWDRDVEAVRVSFQLFREEIVSWSSGDFVLRTIFGRSIGYIILIALLFTLLYFVIGSFVSIGYAKFNLALIDKKEVSAGMLFDYRQYWKNTVATRLLRSAYVLLGTLLLVVPGVVAAFSYAMTDYILAENPELSPREALSRSKAMMEGNRMWLFAFSLSFIGWMLLSALTMGLGSLILEPYMQAARAAFYREVSGTAETVY